MSSRAVIIGIIACGACLACDGAPSGPSQALPMQEVVSIQNAMTGLETPSHSLILTPEAWADVWAEIYATHAPAQKPPLPAIDFGSNVIVLAAAGLRGAQGFSFTIEEVREQRGILDVRIRELWPLCGTLPAESAPVHAVSVPRVATAARFSVITEGPPSC